MQQSLRYLSGLILDIHTKFGSWFWSMPFSNTLLSVCVFSYIYYLIRTKHSSIKILFSPLLQNVSLLSALRHFKILVYYSKSFLVALNMWSVCNFEIFLGCRFTISFLNELLLYRNFMTVAMIKCCTQSKPL